MFRRVSMLGNRTRRFKRTFLSNIYNFRYSTRKEKSMMIIMENDLKKETNKIVYIYILSLIFIILYRY